MCSRVEGSCPPPPPRGSPPKFRCVWACWLAGLAGSGGWQRWTRWTAGTSCWQGCRHIHAWGVEQKQNVMLGTRVLWQSRSKKYEALCLPLSLPSGLPSGLFGPLTPLRTAALTLSTPTTTGGWGEPPPGGEGGLQPRNIYRAQFI